MIFHKFDHLVGSKDLACVSILKDYVQLGMWDMKTDVVVSDPELYDKVCSRHDENSHGKNHSS